MATLVGDHDLCKRMGETGRVKAEREFGLDHLVSGTLAAYKAAGWNNALSSETLTTVLIFSVKSQNAMSMSNLGEQTIHRNPSVRWGIQAWKIPPICKGALTWVPVLNTWRLRRASTGGTNTPRYCYSVWLRHLVTLNAYGFKIAGARIGELGPGDSIGIGLAALLSGATRYIGLDIMPFSAKADLDGIFEELIRLYSLREPIPDQTEFPRVRPRLESYECPAHLIDWNGFSIRAQSVRIALRANLGMGQVIDYRAPWTSPDEIASGRSI